MSQGDAATSHIWAFVFMAILMLVFGMGRVAKETKASVKWKSFLNLWMVAYLVLLAVLRPRGLNDLNERIGANGSGKQKGEADDRGKQSAPMRSGVECLGPGLVV